ncbi:MAG: glycosyltransferase family 2 protein [Bifidobacteriaceae bacterium]|jgi:cellulose synthase/poly-beta-1,6-N-acetylglucosamine synthase-like glycosyltransferase|nr:glycosyltransferase family 2 protein [Bifidobacteriaceae bacterium]
MLEYRNLEIDSEKADRISVSIIIPAYNEEHIITRCLKAAYTQTVPAEEVIIVDNMSTDATHSIVQRFIDEHKDYPGKIEVITQNEVQGRAETRDAGFNHAKSEVLGRIDADSILSHDWVEKVKLAFSDDLVSAATGAVFYYDMPLRTVGMRADNSVRYIASKMSRKYGFLFGTNMAIRATAWQEIKDEVCPDYLDGIGVLHEDIDLGIHLSMHNLQIAYVGSMLVGMSARRIEDSRKDYFTYTKRFSNTMNAHGIESAYFKIPQFFFNTIYFPVRGLKKAYNPYYEKRIDGTYKMDLLGKRFR